MNPFLPLEPKVDYVDIYGTFYMTCDMADDFLPDACSAAGPLRGSTIDVQGKIYIIQQAIIDGPLNEPEFGTCGDSSKRTRPRKAGNSTKVGPRSSTKSGEH